MKKSIKSILITVMLLATLVLVTACVNNDTPYDLNNDEGYTVSVKFDANGGFFTTNTAVIMDSYNISDMEKNANGKVELALLAPDDAIRGSGNSFTATRNGYFLAGWYSERTETGTDKDGNPIYTYANKWDFSKSVCQVDPSQKHSASDPVMTLYAAWVPMFQINFLTMEGEPISSYAFNPTVKGEIKVPEWDDGAMKMYDFPTVSGHTFRAAYYDQKGTQLIEGKVTHLGTVNESTGTAENAVLDVYVDVMEGVWFQIDTVEQFQKHARPDGCYILNADLDFKCNAEDEKDRLSWPTNLMYSTFTGTIQGNGHTISNVELEHNKIDKTNAGLFGMLGEGARLTDLTFDNVTFTIKAGAKNVGSSFGLLAGVLSEKAVVSNLKVVNSTLQVDEKAYFGTDEYAIGKLCGTGSLKELDFSGIACKVVGQDNLLEILEDGNEIVLKFK